jgi:pimeloyl-ACP methyl ester carboxylesterase
MTPDEETLYTHIKKAIEVYSEKGIVCTKVDVVGHSMGGLMARKFLLDNKHNAESLISYKNGLVRRLVTMGTPHLGSNWPSYLINATQDLYEVDTDIDVREKLIFMRPFLAWALDRISKWVGLANNFGRVYREETRRQADGTYKIEEVPITALVDLARSSNFIKKMEESSSLPDVLLYSISGNVVPQLNHVLLNIAANSELGAYALSSLSKWLDIAVRILQLLLPRSNDPTWMHTMFKIMVGDAHDLVVENQSSQWKLPNAYHTLFTDP